MASAVARTAAVRAQILTLQFGAASACLGSGQTREIEKKANLSWSPRRLRWSLTCLCVPESCRHCVDSLTGRRLRAQEEGARRLPSKTNKL